MLKGSLSWVVPASSTSKGNLDATFSSIFMALYITAVAMEREIFCSLCTGLYETADNTRIHNKLTWESYVKAFVAHRKVWYKAKLNTEIPKEACFHTGGQHWASESSYGILEIAILNDGKVIVILLQMERVEHQMDTWKSTGGWWMIERMDTELETESWAFLPTYWLQTKFNVGIWMTTRSDFQVSLHLGYIYQMNQQLRTESLGPSAGLSGSIEHCSEALRKRRTLACRLHTWEK